MKSIALFHLLGEFQAEAGAVRISARDFKHRKALLLLKYLLLKAGYSTHKDEVLEALWPGLDAIAASSQLYKCVHHLRHALQKLFPKEHPKALLSYEQERLSLQLPAQVESDAGVFENMAKAAFQCGTEAELLRALAAWRGDLLPSDYQEAWTETPRQRLQELHLELMRRLAAIFSEEKRIQEAADLFRQILQRDELDEAANLGLVRCLALQGNRLQAIRHFEQYAKVLQERTGMPPGTEACALFDAVCQERLQPLADANERPFAETASHLPLAGRHSERAWFSPFFENARQGRGQAILLTGPSGIGKSALLHDIVRQARLKTLNVVTFSHEDQGKGNNWTAFARLMNRLVASMPFLAPLLPETFRENAEPSPSADRLAAQHYLFDEVLQLLRGASERQPLLLAIDNLHATARAEWQLFQFLAEHIAPLPIVLLGVFRNDIGLPEGLTSLMKKLPCLTLGPLDPEDHLVLLQTAAKARLPKKLADRIYALTEGHPLYSKTLLEAQMRTGRLIEKDGQLIENPGTPLQLPPTLAFLILKQTESTSPLTQKLLHLLAVAADWVHVTTLETLLHLPRAAFLEHLDELLERQLIRCSGLYYTIAHPMVQTVVYDVLVIGERKRLHLALAKALQQETPLLAAPPAEAIAWHFQKGGAEEQALETLLEAAGQAADVYAHQDAIRLYEAALQLPPMESNPGRKAATLELLADIHKAIGDVSTALELYRQALEVSKGQLQPGQMLSLKKKIALASIIVLDMPSAGQLLEELKTGLQPEALDAAGYHIVKALYLWHFNELEQCIEEGKRALAIAEAFRAEREMSQACEMLALAHFPLGRWEEGLHYEQKRSVAGWSPDVVIATDAHLCLWEYHINGDEPYEQASRFIRAVSQQADELGDLRCVAVCHYALGSIAFLRADFASAQEHLEKARLLHYRIKAPVGEAYTLARLAQVFTRQGDLDAGWQVVQDGLKSARRGAVNDHALMRLYAVALQNRLAAADLRSAAAFILHLEELETRGSCCPSCSVPLYLEAAQFFASQKDFYRADNFCEKARQFVDMTGNPIAQAHLDHCRSRILFARGQNAEAAELARISRLAFTQLGHKVML